MPVFNTENRKILQLHDFNTASNIKLRLSKLFHQFLLTIMVITNWVLSGANITELTNFNIHLQIMRGFDGYQNVLMTGYYSPIPYARHTPQGQFKKIQYRMPVKNKSKSSTNYGRMNGKKI